MTLSDNPSGFIPSAHSRISRPNWRNLIDWNTLFIVPCDGIPLGSRSLFFSV